MNKSKKNKELKLLEKKIEYCANEFGHTKVMIEHPTGGESVWATFPTKEDYNKSRNLDSPVNVIMMNNALVDVPTWGVTFTISKINQYGVYTITLKDLLKQVPK